MPGFAENQRWSAVGPQYARIILERLRWQKQVKTKACDLVLKQGC
ncbi:YjjA family protein [Escherichia coli]|nr:YjjA family protein [Escherichia coli]